MGLPVEKATQKPGVHSDTWSRRFVLGCWESNKIRRVWALYLVLPPSFLFAQSSEYLDVHAADVKPELPCFYRSIEGFGHGRKSSAATSDVLFPNHYETGHTCKVPAMSCVPSLPLLSVPSLPGTSAMISCGLPGLWADTSITG